MKKINVKFKIYNKNLVKKTIGTGAFVLVAAVSSSKPLTMICSISAGLLIANIASNIKANKKDNHSLTKREIIVNKLKELKEELTINENKKPIIKSEKQTVIEKIEPKINVKKAVPVQQKLSPLDEYISKVQSSSK